MSDVLRELLRDAADARLSATGIPPVSVIHARVELPGRRPRRTRWLAPVVAAAAVVALVIAVAQLPSLHREAGEPAVVVPPAPKLVDVVPPLVVRQRLGAPAGHLNGPAVASAETLAVSPDSDEAGRLRTVAVVTPHAPDGKGNPLVNRCRYTYSEPDAAALNGRCDWAVAATLPEPDEALTLEVKGGPGQTWLQGTAPVGTAAVAVRSPGREEVVVAVGDPGESWGHRPFYAVWRDRIATDLIAVDRAGHELGRAHLPSEEATHRAGDPQLGTVETPLDLWERHRPQKCIFPSPGATPPTASPCRPTSTPKPPRVDVLARFEISDTVTLLRYGLIAGEHRCVIDIVRDIGADAQPGGGGGGCGSGPQTEENPIQAGRSFSAGTGLPQEQILSGTAVRGTVRVRLSASGVKSVVVPAYDGGERWAHRSFFVAPWPSAPHTTVEALGRDGQVLASTISRGLNPRAFDTDFLEAVATCVEKRGMEVVRTPQGHGMAPAYEFRAGTLPADQVRAAQEACEDEADRDTS
jgi:hypothetical protein